MKKFDFYHRRNDEDKLYIKLSICVFLVAIAIILFEKVIGHLPALGTSITSGFRYLTSLTSPFLLGFAIAYVMNPFMKFFERHFKKHIGYFRTHPKTTRILCILLNYFIIIGGSVWITIYLLPEITDSILALTTQIPTYSANMTERIQTLFDKISFIDSNDVNSIINRILQPMVTASQNVPALLETIIGNLFVFGRATLNAIMAIFIAFYMLYDKENFSRQIKKIIYALSTPRHARHFLYTSNRIHHIFQDFIVGKAVDSLIIGILAFMGMTIIKAPFPLILSLIIGVTNMIPYFGPFIGAIPAIIITLLINPITALWVGIFILILQQFDGNFLGPKILGNSLDLSPLWIILAVVIGGALLGPVGMFIGVPIFATVKTFSSEYINRQYWKKYPASNPLELVKEETGEFKETDE